MSRLADVPGVALTVARVATEHDVKYPAVAMAYYTFVSFVPLLVLVLAVIGESAATRIQVATPQFLTPEASRLVYQAMTTASGRTGASALAVAVLGWSGANVAVGFQTVVERVEGTPEGSLSEQLRDAVSVLLSLGLAIVTILLTNVTLALEAVGLRFPGANLLVMPVVLTVAFSPLYYLPSRLVQSVSAALPGALVAALGWTALLAGIHFYASNAAQYAVYGVLSGVILIVTSLYLAAVILMVGVVVNATLANRRAVSSTSHH